MSLQNTNDLPSMTNSILITKANNCSNQTKLHCIQRVDVILLCKGIKISQLTFTLQNYKETLLSGIIYSSKLRGVHIISKALFLLFAFILYCMRT